MKELTNEEIQKVLREVKDGVLALSDGRRPYCIPFGFVYVNGAVYISLFPRGRKWDCFQKNHLVCFNAYCWNSDHTEWYSVVIDGELEQVADMETIEAVVRANILKSGLSPSDYLEKRLAYYRASLENPDALKIFKIKARAVSGRKMRTLIGS